jgi:hypothetical protein
MAANFPARRAAESYWGKALMYSSSSAHVHVFTAEGKLLADASTAYLVLSMCQATPSVEDKV